MNQRIQSLIEQATSHMPGRPPYDGLTFDEFDKEKFAELIVRECAEVAKETRWAVPPSQEQIARGIKQHFGVEE